jgi:hypothetical protein
LARQSGDNDWRRAPEYLERQQRAAELARLHEARGHSRPRGRETRPPRLQNARDAFRTSAPPAITRGHFYFVKNGDISISR